MNQKKQYKVQINNDLRDWYDGDEIKDIRVPDIMETLQNDLAEAENMSEEDLLP